MEQHWRGILHKLAATVVSNGRIDAFVTNCDILPTLIHRIPLSLWARLPDVIQRLLAGVRLAGGLAAYFNCHGSKMVSLMGFVFGFSILFRYKGTIFGALLSDDDLARNTVTLIFQYLFWIHVRNIFNP